MHNNPKRRYLPAPAVSDSLARLQPFREDFSFNFDIYSIYEQEEFGGVIPYLIRQVKRLVKIMALLALSMISYHVFYLSAMPSFSVSVPVYFDYTESAISTSHLQSCESYKRKEDTLATPWASIDLFARHHWDSFAAKDVLPPPHTSHQLLVPNRAYFMDIVLVLPDSDTNRDAAGIFGVNVELASHNGTVLAFSRRSARFPHQSRWISILTKFVLLLPLMLGAMEESKYVIVSVFRNYVESINHPLRHIRLRITPQQSAKATIEITKAEVKMGKEFNALQNFIRDWYFTCYTIGTAVFMAFYALIWIISETIREDARERLQSEAAQDLKTSVSDHSSYGDVPSQHLDTNNLSDQDSDWDDIFYDIPVVDETTDSS